MLFKTLSAVRVTVCLSILPFSQDMAMPFELEQGMGVVVINLHILVSEDGMQRPGVANSFFYILQDSSGYSWSLHSILRDQTNIKMCRLITTTPIPFSNSKGIAMSCEKGRMDRQTVENVNSWRVRYLSLQLLHPKNKLWMGEFLYKKNIWSTNLRFF